MSQARRYRHSITVEWGDCDPAQIVFYPTYFKWFDQSTWRLFGAVGLTRASLRERFGIIGYPLVSVGCDFKIASRPGDTLFVESHVRQWSLKSFTVAHSVQTPEGIVTATGYETRVWAIHKPDTDQLATLPLPDEVRRLLGGE